MSDQEPGLRLRNLVSSQKWIKLADLGDNGGRTAPSAALVSILHINLIDRDSCPMIHSRADAFNLLAKLGAPTRLITHLQLVGEAAQMLMEAYTALGMRFDANWIELGVAVHDAGKILHSDELNGPGSMHEAAGEALLIRNGVQPESAKCCVSHAKWHEPEVSFEERSVALADKLWKGKREAGLELLIVDEIASKLGISRWDVFANMDSVFEAIAAGATERLERSVV